MSLLLQLSVHDMAAVLSKNFENIVVMWLQEIVLEWSIYTHFELC